jgi:protein involved in polysaccharide export with SLBB domain
MRGWRCRVSFSLIVWGIFASGCAQRSHEWVWATRSTAAVPAIAPAKAEVTPRPGWRFRPEDELAPGFEVGLACASDPAVTGTYRVELDGTLKLPYRVVVHVAGRKTGDVALEIERGLKPFIKNSATTVTIKRRTYWVDVQGLVEKPGPVLVQADTSLDEIIAGGGGLQETPERRTRAEYVRIVQGGATGTFKLRDHFAGTLSGLPRWQGGEKIFFQSEGAPAHGGGTVARRYINLLGEVRSPGEYPYEYADFYRYLIAAGGPTDRADLDNIALVRERADAVGATTFTLHEPTLLPSLEPGDTVIVRADNPSPLEKKSRVIGGFMSILTSIATVVLLFVVV